MNRIKKIINRLNDWMNKKEYDAKGYLISTDNVYECILDNKNINVYHLDTNKLLAIISPDLKFKMLDLIHNNEKEEYDNFRLRQYTHSILVRILSTI